MSLQNVQMTVSKASLRDRDLDDQINEEKSGKLEPESSIKTDVESDGVVSQSDAEQFAVRRAEHLSHRRKSYPAEQFNNQRKYSTAGTQTAASSRRKSSTDSRLMLISTSDAEEVTQEISATGVQRTESQRGDTQKAESQRGDTQKAESQRGDTQKAESQRDKENGQSQRGDKDNWQSQRGDKENGQSECKEIENGKTQRMVGGNSGSSENSNNADDADGEPTALPVSPFVIVNNTDSLGRRRASMPHSQRHVLGVVQSQQQSTASGSPPSVMRAPPRRTTRMRSASNVANLMTCSVCTRPFNESAREPKLLPCHHTYCRKCLLLIVNEHGFVDCPTCRQRIHVKSPEHVGALQTNFYITQMQEVLNHKEPYDKQMCDDHERSPAAFFCKTCETKVCSLCLTERHQERQGHVSQPMSLALQEQTQHLQVEIMHAREKISQNKQQLQILETEVGTMLAAKRQAQQDIEDAFGGYIEALSMRKCELHAELKELHRERRLGMVAAMEELHRQTRGLSRTIAVCEDSIKRRAIGELVANNGKIAERNVETRKSGRPSNSSYSSSHSSSHSSSSPGLNYLEFEPGQQQDLFLAALDSLGRLESNKCLPSSVHPTTSAATACLPSSVRIKVVGQMQQELPDYPIRVEIDDSQRHAIPTAVQHHERGVYDVTFVPIISGSQRCRVLFLGQPIPGGTFTVHVEPNAHVARFGAELFPGRGRMLSPGDVAVDRAKGFVYVADVGNRRFVRLDRNGRIVDFFKLNNLERQLHGTSCVLDEKRATIVSCMSKLSKSAKIVSSTSVALYSLETGRLRQLDCAEYVTCVTSVAVTANGLLVLCDAEGDRLVVLDRDGRLVRSFGRRGSGQGQLKRPTSVCVTSNDNVVVCDSGNDRVQVLELTTGRFLYEFGSSDSGKLNSPCAVVCDRKGHVLVVDGGNKIVKIFRTSGRLVGCIEGSDGEFVNPVALACTHDGHVLVCDRDADCIKKYRYLPESE